MSSWTLNLNKGNCYLLYCKAAKRTSSIDDDIFSNYNCIVNPFSKPPLQG